MRPLMFALIVLSCSGNHAYRATAPVDRNRISAEEIQSTHIQNAYDAVRRLRPRWLEARGVTSFQKQLGVALVVEGVHVGDVSHLRDYDTSDISELKFLSAPEATQLYGIDHTAGAIQLFLKHGR